MGALLEEVVGSDVIGALGPQPDAGSVIQPEPGALRLRGGDLQPLASAIAVAAILPDQLDDIGGQARFIRTAPGILRCLERC